MMGELHGSLAGIGLARLLTLLGDVKKDGLLRVRDGQRTAEILVQSIGQQVEIVAICGNDRGLAALETAVVVLGDGSFTFAQQGTGTPYLVSASSTAVRLPLDELRARMDEMATRRARLLKRVPSLAAVPRRVEQDDRPLPHAGGDGKLVLDRTAIALLLTMDGLRTVDEIVGARPLLPTIEQLATLVELGLAEVAAPAEVAPPTELVVMETEELATALETRPERHKASRGGFWQRWRKDALAEAPSPLPARLSPWTRSEQSARDGEPDEPSWRGNGHAVTAKVPVVEPKGSTPPPAAFEVVPPEPARSEEVSVASPETRRERRKRRGDSRELVQRAAVTMHSSERARAGLGFRHPVASMLLVLFGAIAFFALTQLILGNRSSEAPATAARGTATTTTSAAVNSTRVTATLAAAPPPASRLAELQQGARAASSAPSNPAVAPPPSLAQAALPTAAPTPTSGSATTVPTGSRVVLDERFTGTLRGWPNNPQGVAWQAPDGTYHIAARQPGRFVAIGAPIASPLRDVVLRATLRKVDGPSGGGYGLIVRDGATRQRDGTSLAGPFYVMEVSDIGEVGIWRRDGDQWVDILPWTRNNAVKQGLSPNTLEVSAIGDKLTFRVNGVEVASEVDGTLTEGGVGLFVGGDGNEAIAERFTVEERPS